MIWGSRGGKNCNIWCWECWQNGIRKNKNRVAYFIDNDVQLHGRTIDGIVIKSVEDFIQDKDKYQLVIASYSQKMIEQQVIEMGLRIIGYF